MVTAIERNGNDVITFPQNMTHDEVINRLKADRELENYGEAMVEIEEVIPRFPYEAAHALTKAVKELHGAGIGHNIYLSDGDVITTKCIGVPVSPTESIQVPWGPFHLPDVEGEFQTLSMVENGAVVMKLVAKVKRKYQEKVKQLADRTRELADKESIYRGRAIMMKFRNDKGELDLTPPTFMDLSGDHRVIFSDEVMRAIKANILMPIKYPQRALRLKVPTKRGALLVGTFGTGKTLTARWMAKEATSAVVPRTFIYLADASELPDAIRFASQYAPALIFGEDIDRVVFGPRTSMMDRAFNTVDGVDSKNLNVIIVLTTNNLDMIHPGFLREGRMDSIIDIGHPDMKATEELLRHFGGGLIAQDERLARLAAELQGQSPAYIREIVEGAKLDKLLELEEQIGDQADEAAVDAIRLTAKDLELAFHHHRDERAVISQMVRECEYIAHLVEQFGGASVLRGGRKAPTQE